MSESAGWMAVLERIEQSLQQSLELAPEVPSATTSKGVESGPLEKLDSRLSQWQACLEQVERQASASEGELDGDQAAVADWLRNVALVREKLAEAVRRGV